MFVCCWLGFVQYLFFFFNWGGEERKKMKGIEEDEVLWGEIKGKKNE